MRLLSLLLIAGVSTTMAQSNWPDWRGPRADGHTEAKNLPLRWSETENVTWKTAIHDLGHSSPVVWNDQCWITTATEDGTVLYAMAIDVNSGEIIHDIDVFHVTEPQRINPSNTYATPSPVIADGRVYVHYGTFGTACIDTATGEVLWRRADLHCDHMQGPASSPVLFGNLVIIHLEGVEKPSIVALDTQRGETAWVYTRPESLYTADLAGVYIKSYQSPVFIDVDGRPQMVSNGALMATGHDPRSGEEIWRIRYRDDSTISRIVAGRGLLFINTGGSPGKTQLWAVRQGGTGDVTDSHAVWKLTEDVPHESSPVLVEDLLYAVSDHGVLHCIEADTGSIVWTERLPGKYAASLLAAGDRIYLSNKKGVSTVIAAGRSYRELSVNTLDGELWSSPATTGDALLLRSKTHLYRIEIAPQEP